MQAALYERSTGSASPSLRVIELPRPEPHAGEVRVRLCWSGVNPGDLRAGGDARVHLPALAGSVPHNDGAGVIDGIGEGISPQRLGERVWVWNAAWQRAWGRAAQWVALSCARRRRPARPAPGRSQAGAHPLGGWRRNPDAGCSI